MIGLYTLFGGFFTKALQIVDMNDVICFGPELYAVCASDPNLHYTVSPSYCSCRSFSDSVVAKAESLYCKHQLALFLARAIGKIQFRVKDDGNAQKIKQLLSQEVFRQI